VYIYIYIYIYILSKPADNFRSVLFRNCTQPRVVILDFLTSEGGTDSFPETSVQNYHFTPRNIPEERRPHLHRDENHAENFFNHLSLSLFYPLWGCERVTARGKMSFWSEENQTLLYKYLQEAKLLLPDMNWYIFIKNWTYNWKDFATF